MRPMKHTLTLLNFQIARLRWPGMLGMVLIVLALLVDVTQIKPLEAALEAAGQRPAPQARTTRLSTLKQPAAAPYPDLEKLFAVAEQVDINLSQGQYRLENLADGSRRLHIDLPIQADYPSARHFLAQALSEMPDLSLAHLQLSRERIDDAVLSVHMQFILTLKKG